MTKDNILEPLVPFNNTYNFCVKISLYDCDSNGIQIEIEIGQLAKESEIMARKKLLEGPEERAKTRKKERKDQKIVRVVKKVPITFYTCNASHITNKMPILAHDVGKHKFDVVHITEAGLLKKEPTGMTGYKSVKLVRKEPNRGSVIWVRQTWKE